MYSHVYYINLLMKIAGELIRIDPKLDTVVNLLTKIEVLADKKRSI